MPTYTALEVARMLELIEEVAYEIADSGFYGNPPNQNVIDRDIEEVEAILLRKETE